MFLYLLFSSGLDGFIKEIFEIPLDDSDSDIVDKIYGDRNKYNYMQKRRGSGYDHHNQINDNIIPHNSRNQIKTTGNGNVYDYGFDPSYKRNRQSSNNYYTRNENTKEMMFPYDHDADFIDKVSYNNQKMPPYGAEQNYNKSSAVNYGGDDRNSCVQTINKSHSQKCYVALISKMNAKIQAVLEQSNVTNRYSNYTKGVAFCTNEPIASLKSDPDVLYIEEDKYYYTASIQLNVPNHMFFMMNYGNYVFNNTLFDNYVMRFLPFKYLYKFFYSYYRYRYTGRNVEIYMIDTTVNEEFEDIKGRVINTCRNGICGNVGFDDIINRDLRSNQCIRHGTNVADLIIGRVNGFAKDARIKVLNIFDCEGKAKMSSIIAALETIVPREKTIIVNMSLSGPHSEVFNYVLGRLPKNMILITAAGNNSDISCNYSPGSSTDVINVGSVDPYADISKFSNFSSCVRIYSIGERININREINGTSYSSALVAGSVAVYLESNPYAKSADVWNFLSQNADLIHGNYLIQKVPHVHERSVMGMALKSDGEFYWGSFVIVAYFALFISAILLGWVAIKNKRAIRLRI